MKQILVAYGPENPFANAVNSTLNLNVISKLQTNLCAIKLAGAVYKYVVVLYKLSGSPFGDASLLNGILNVPIKLLTELETAIGP